MFVVCEGKVVDKCFAWVFVCLNVFIFASRWIFYERDTQRLEEAFLFYLGLDVVLVRRQDGAYFS